MEKEKELVIEEVCTQTENAGGAGRNLAVVGGTVVACVGGYFLVKGVIKLGKFTVKKIGTAVSNAKAKHQAKKAAVEEADSVAETTEAI